ncbi:hypothetical protein B0A48_12571 [Cryoendolithus antarcticus]|uniref:HMG box domain-containing protein n=1 Tax=Cryoendolithus antarcticus TaxID=1507870 RepID=A0A1V8SQU8_9PEZI|nr:hypothetical protein B0A48_12571 [Cryoendolithus antarcticus]
MRDDHAAPATSRSAKRHRTRRRNKSRLALEQAHGTLTSVSVPINASCSAADELRESLSRHRLGSGAHRAVVPAKDTNVAAPNHIESPITPKSVANRTLSPSSDEELLSREVDNEAQETIGDRSLTVNGTGADQPDITEVDVQHCAECNIKCDSAVALKYHIIGSHAVLRVFACPQCDVVECNELEALRHVIWSHNAPKPSFQIIHQFPVPGGLWKLEKVQGITSVESGPYLMPSSGSSNLRIPWPKNEQSDVRAADTADTSYMPRPRRQTVNAPIKQVGSAILNGIKALPIKEATVKQCTCDSTQDAIKGNVPRPPNSFMVFRSWYAKRNGALGSAQQSMSSAAGRAWNDLDETEKKRFKVMADETAAQHVADNPGYKYDPLRKAKLAFGDESCECGAFEANCDALKRVMRNTGGKRGASRKSTMRKVESDEDADSESEVKIVKRSVRKSMELRMASRKRSVTDMDGGYDSGSSPLLLSHVRVMKKQRVEQPGKA